jgi:hypothetical protein
MRVKSALKEENLKAAFDFYDAVFFYYELFYRIKMGTSP